MLAKKKRLTAFEVREVIAQGRSLRAGLLSAKYIATSTPLRASVVVSKKTARRAIERNRVRRAVYRALRAMEAQGTYVIFVQKVPPPPLTPHFHSDLLLLTQRR